MRPLSVPALDRDVAAKVLVPPRVRVRIRSGQDAGAGDLVAGDGHREGVVAVAVDG